MASAGAVGEGGEPLGQQLPMARVLGKKAKMKLKMG
jgi:hypothetical protein